MDFGDGLYGTVSDKHHCPNCNASPKKFELRDYSLVWHDGEIWCTACETFIRHWDAG